MRPSASASLAAPLASAVLALLAALAPVPARAEEVDEVIQQEVPCTNVRGNEISLRRDYTAAPGMVFTTYAATLQRGRSFAGDAECRIRDVTTSSIPVQYKGITINAQVATHFAVTAHADCGAGLDATMQHMRRHDSIAVSCRVTAAEAALR
jgi:hypothetical protein